MEEKGLVIAGTSPDGRLVEAVELPDRDFHIGVQFHPEFKSRPNRAHPLFKGFIRAAMQHLKDRTLREHNAWASTEQQTNLRKRIRATFRHGSFLLYQLYRQAGGFSGTSLFRG